MTYIAATDLQSKDQLQYSDHNNTQYYTIHDMVNMMQQMSHKIMSGKNKFIQIFTCDLIIVI